MKSFSYIVENKDTHQTWLMPTLECVSKHIGKNLTCVYRSVAKKNVIDGIWSVKKCSNEDTINDLMDDVSKLETNGIPLQIERDQGGQDA